MEHPPAPERLTLRDTTKLPISGGGWVLLGERPPEELALGLVGKFWWPVIEFADVRADAFRDWAEPGFAKTIRGARRRRARLSPRIAALSRPAPARRPLSTRARGSTSTCGASYEGLSSSPQRSYGRARLTAAEAARSVAAMSFDHKQPFNVLIAGAGVAGLEAALALRDLAGEHIATTLLAPEPEFVYRPLRMHEPFAYSAAQHYPLDEIARDIGFELKLDAFMWLDPARRVVHTEGREELSYDALLLALGARLHPRFSHALTLDDQRLDEQLHGLIQDVEIGYIHKLAFIAPSQMPWPLPLYELALMTARRAYDMNEDLSIALATPEDAPLAIFGTAVSEAVQNLLTEHGIRMIPSAHCETPAPGQVSIHPGSRRLHVDRVIALPELFGPSAPGVPQRDGRGFIPIDIHCRVPELERVFAAGDATDFTVKHGGIAAQQADVAAESIAALAGAPVEPTKFHPVIRGILLGGNGPLYLTAEITGGHGSSSDVSEQPTWSPATKIAAKYLAPYLESRDRAAVR
jgi:sulfide:quinone oxidoreductase